MGRFYRVRSLDVWKIRIMPLFVSLFTCFIFFAVPAFAVDTTRYVPQIPPFLKGSSGSYAIECNYDFGMTDDLKKFFDTYKKSPYVVLLDQQTTNGYYMGKNYGNDRIWSVMFAKRIESTSAKTTFGHFVYNDPLLYPTYASHPIRLAGGNGGFEVVTLYYNYEKNSFDRATYQPNVGYFLFSYVIGNSPLSNSVSFYPGYRTLDGKSNFEAGPADVKGIEKHYSWWLSSGSVNEKPLPKPEIDVDTDGDGEPDLNVDKDGDGKPDVNIDTDKDGKPDLNIDQDGDGIPDVNIDTDKDGKPDLNIDQDGDGIPDVDIDIDKDGKPDVNIDKDGDGESDVNIDKDGDSKPDLNIDKDGDGKPDVNIDTDGNGRPNINIDTDGDGKPNTNIDKDGDGRPDINIDTDGDGKPDVNIDEDWEPGGGGSSSGGSGSGGSSSGGSGSGDGDYGDDWFPSSSGGGGNFKDFPLFDPFDYDNYTPPTSGNPFDEYDPMDGITPPKNLPEFNVTLPDYNFHNPFKKPWL